MTKQQRKAIYLEAAEAVLTTGRQGLYYALKIKADEPVPELNAVLYGRYMASRAMPDDLRCLLLCFAAAMCGGDDDSV